MPHERGLSPLGDWGCPHKPIALNGKLFADGSHIIYVNNKIKDSTPLGQLMHDFSCKEPADMHYSVFAERATYFKKNEKGREEMSEVMERFAKQVVWQQKIDFALRCLRKGYTEEEAADLADIPLEEVQKLAEKRIA